MAPQRTSRGGPPVSEVEYLAHYGVKGMRWGVRKKDRQSSTDSGPKSTDAKTARDHRATVKKSGTDALSNKELQELVTRLNLEQQYSKLNAQTTTAGKRFVNGSKNMGKSLAKELVKEYAKQGAKTGVKVVQEFLKEKIKKEKE